MTMQFKKIFSYLFFLLLCCSCLSVFADKKPTASPILTPINGLTITSKAGQITLKNTSGKDISVSSMLLSFTLDQASIPSVWGTPWLNWQPYTASVKTTAPISYQFTNQVDLPDDNFVAGSSIIFQYSPQLAPTAVPNNVQAFNLTYPLSPAQISSSVSSSGGVNTMTITNMSGKNLNLHDAQLRLTYSGQISSVWGTPWANWKVTGSAPSYVLTVGTSVQMPANGNLIVSFSGSSQPITNISLWVESAGGEPAQQGGIGVNLPAAPAGATVNPSVTVTGPSFPQGQTNAGTWGQTLKLENLQIGSYSLSAPDVQGGSQSFSPTFTPNPVVVSSGTTATVNLAYAPKALAKLMIQMPIVPATGVASPTLTVQGTDFPAATFFATSWGNTLQICKNGASSCNGIAPGSYTITVPKVYSATDAFSASGIANPVVITSDKTTTLPIAYAPIPQGSFAVTISSPFAKGSKQSKANYAVKFTNAAGFDFVKNLVTGNNTVSLPINDTYLITPPIVVGQSTTVTPTSVTVAQTGTPAVSIKYVAGVASNKFVVYYGGWQGDLFNLNTKLPANVTAVNLSFANITPSLQVDTATSGWITNIPAPSVQMQPTYINWTVFKYNRPNTKVLLAVGGATFSSIWTNILTPATADTMAKNIAAVVNANYPVYKGNISYPADLLGTVTIDGVDLDIEAGGRLTPAISSNVSLLITSLKKYLNPGKLLTFAAFSVGADPNTSQCTVPGSIHCGEDIPLLQASGAQFDWVNLMAYDAGQEYANSLYKVAMANYALYLPKNKILLGLDIQTQWPGFNETKEQLAAKAAWQKQNGYAGAMFWGVGVQNDPASESQFVNAISAALN